MEEQVDIESNQNPQRRKRKKKARKKPALESKVQRNYINGRLSNVDKNNIQGSTKGVGGYIQDGPWTITNNRNFMEVLFTSCDSET